MRDFTSENLPHDSISAKHLLQEHLAAYKNVEDLYAYTVEYGEDAIKAAGQEDNFGSPKEEIERLISVSKERHEEWSNLWEAHKRKLQESVNVCQFEQDINQVVFRI